MLLKAFVSTFSVNIYVYISCHLSICSSSLFV